MTSRRAESRRSASIPPVIATVPAPKITNSRLPRNSPISARRASADASSSFTVVAGERSLRTTIPRSCNASDFAIGASLERYLVPRYPARSAPRGAGQSVSDPAGLERTGRGETGAICHRPCHPGAASAHGDVEPAARRHLRTLVLAEQDGRGGRFEERRALHLVTGRQRV